MVALMAELYVWVYTILFCTFIINFSLYSSINIRALEIGKLKSKMHGGCGGGGEAYVPPHLCETGPLSHAPPDPP